MKLAASVQPVNDLQNLIKSRFAEFNRQSSPSRGRKYPPELRELICVNSGASRQPVPFEIGRRFRLKSAGDSGVCGMAFRPS
jgi:hypothetical protein